MNMDIKPNERQLLREQMELLAGRSKHCANDELPALTWAMTEIYKTLYWQPPSARQGEKRTTGK